MNMTRQCYCSKHSQTGSRVTEYSRHMKKKYVINIFDFTGLNTDFSSAFSTIEQLNGKGIKSLNCAIVGGRM